MEWELILCDLSSEVLQIPFRHPHNLFKEIPEQKTALLQINHIYEGYLRELKLKEDYLQYGVVGWNFTLSRRVAYNFIKKFDLLNWVLVVVG